MTSGRKFRNNPLIYNIATDSPVLEESGALP
jgi:hypothetical protein